MMGIINSLREAFAGEGDTQSFEETFDDALSGDLAGENTATGTPPVAGTSGFAIVTGALGRGAGLISMGISPESIGNAFGEAAADDTSYQDWVVEQTGGDSYGSGGDSGSNGGGGNGDGPNLARTIEQVGLAGVLIAILFGIAWVIDSVASVVDQ